MSAHSSRWPLQLFRLGSLVLPPALAWQVAFSEPHPTRLTSAVVYALGPLWLLLAGALALRCLDTLLRPRRRRRDGAAEVSLLDRLDVLTSSGSALSWLSAAGIITSVWVGWASLSVVGLLGTALLGLVVLWTFLVAGGNDPFRRASITRRFVPEITTEGEPVTEELLFSRPRIPVGFRLFAQGRVGPRWPLSRCVLDESSSGGEVLIENDLGPALRGEHRAEPLDLWLQDVFGLCRLMRVRAGNASLTVLPRLYPVTGAKELLGRGGVDLEPRPAIQLPTEGSLHLREYQPGDDARRVHWVRSLTAGELVVRLPDELPPDRPSARVVLDTFLPCTEAFSCTAPAALLDALVEVWLSVGRALADNGARVTLVMAAQQGESVEPQTLRLSPMSEREALHLGAKASWQSNLPVEGLLGSEPSFIVSCRIQPLLTGSEKSTEARWILVPEASWTCFDVPAPAPSTALLPHPLGSSDNRWSRRRRAQKRWWRALRDHTAFSRQCSSTVDARAGNFRARPQRSTAAGPRQIGLEVLR